MQVKDIMTIDVLSVSPETKIKQVATILFENNLTGLPVVDQKNEVVGIVTEYDLMSPGIQFLRSPEIQKSSSRQISREITEIIDDKIEQIMTTEVVTVTPETDLATLTELITKQRINPIPVVNKTNMLVGIISRSDLVKLLKETTLISK